MNCMLNGKAPIIIFIVGLIKKTYFPEPKSSWGKGKVELYLSSYATKANFKNATGVIYQNLLIRLI